MIASVEVRDLAEPEIRLILHYWYHSPNGFIESMGVDPSKLPPESVMRDSLLAKVREDKGGEKSKLNAVVILAEGRPIGFHTLFPFTEGESGIFHAHIWDKSYRGKGIGMKSYPLACKVFMKRFRLEKILFKTPVQNRGAIRVKEKLGIRHIGEEIIGFGIIRDNTQAKIFELTAAELKNLPAKV